MLQINCLYFHYEKRNINCIFLRTRNWSYNFNSVTKSWQNMITLVSWGHSFLTLWRWLVWKDKMMIKYLTYDNMTYAEFVPLIETLRSLNSVKMSMIESFSEEISTLVIRLFWLLRSKIYVHFFLSMPIPISWGYMIL